jgi:hypothetical protein
MHRQTVKSGNAFERHAELPPLSTKYPGFGGHPQRPVGARQDFVDDVACQAAFCGVALPLSVAAPLGQAAAGQTNPESSLAVFQDRIDRSAQADGAVDFFPAILVPDQQPY